MANPITHLRTLLPVAAGAALLGLAPAAAAQSACGARYTVEPGDTLYEIAQQCRVSMSRVMELNPGLEPRNMTVGAQLRLEAEPRTRPARDSAQARQEGYQVQEGDTAYSIASRLGLSLFDLLAGNEAIDPDDLEPGQVIDIPGSERRAAFSIDPHSGPAGGTVEISARNLRPEDWVTIGAGEIASEWRRITEVQTSSRGTVDARVDVPRWAEPGDRLIFVIDTDRGITLKSSDFRVTGDGFDDQPGRIVSLEGRLERGTECYVLTTAQGEEYALISDDVRFDAGEHVRLEGRRTDASFCQQGRGTIDVGLLKMITPPGRDGPDGRHVHLEGRIGEGTECHTLTTPDGSEYALVGGDVRFVHGEYVEISGRHTEAAICQEGSATIEVNEIREVSPPRDDRARIELRGWVEAGTECPILRASDGRVYALTGSNVQDRTGEFVEIAGRRAEISFCMQGEATIEVDQIREP